MYWLIFTKNVLEIYFKKVQGFSTFFIWVPLVYPLNFVCATSLYFLNLHTPNTYVLIIKGMEQILIGKKLWYVCVCVGKGEGGLNSGSFSKNMDNILFRIFNIIQKTNKQKKKSARERSNNNFFCEILKKILKSMKAAILIQYVT